MLSVGFHKPFKLAQLVHVQERILLLHYLFLNWLMRKFFGFQGAVQLLTRLLGGRVRRLYFLFEVGGEVGLLKVLRERTSRWQEGQHQVQGLGVEGFGVLVGELGGALTDQELKLHGDAVVGGGHEHDLLEHGVSGELVRAVDLSEEFLSLEAVQVHHVTDVQIVDPVILGLDAQAVPRIQLQPRVRLQHLQFALLRERDVQFAPVVLRRDPVLALQFQVPPFGRLLAHAFEVCQQRGQFTKDRVCF